MLLKTFGQNGFAISDTTRYTKKHARKCGNQIWIWKFETADNRLQYHQIVAPLCGQFLNKKFSSFKQDFNKN
jgi:hypothetical protein